MINEQKRAVLESLLPWCPFVVINYGCPGVQAPQHLRDIAAQGQNVIQVGRDPKVMGMPDLCLDATGWCATISIQGTRYYIGVPWEAVTQIFVTDESNAIVVMVLLTEVLARHAGVPAAAAEVPKPVGKPTLTLVR